MRIRIGIPLTLNEIASSIGSVAHANNKIEYIVTDSKEVLPGDLFIALQGDKHNGEDYVLEAINKGAIPMSTVAYSKGIQVFNTRTALLSLAKYYINKLKKLRQKIGITGSVGKTTTKEFLKIILSEEYKTHTNYGNYNNEIGMPLSILAAPHDTEILICELGMNHSGEIDRMAKALCPDIAIITNIGSSHIGNLGSREAIAKAKLEICNTIANKATIIPKNEPLLYSSINKITFSVGDTNADFSLKSTGENNVTIYLRGNEMLSMNFAFTDSHLHTALLIAIAAASLAGADTENIKKGVSKISSDNIRQKVISCSKFNFYTDFYNSSPESLFAAFESLFKLYNFTKKSAIIGDILELGKFAESIHYDIGKRLSEYNLHRLYLFGPLSKYIYNGAIDSNFPSERIFLNTNDNLHYITAQQIKENSNYDEIILMKASRALKLERILDYFTTN